jgi:hypothetical protein
MSKDADRNLLPASTIMSQAMRSLSDESGKITGI